jgi:NAD(P)H-hydrate epimerase
MLAVTAEQMGLIDRAAVERDGETSLVRLAGAAIAGIVARYRGEGPIVAFAGNGNNGGDAFSALAELDGPRVAYHDPAHDGSATRVGARERARASGAEFRSYPADALDLRMAGLLLDGLLGVNVHFPLDAPVAARVSALNAAGVPILALDIATGTDPTTGALSPTHIRAIATIALGRPKVGSLLEPGRDATGDLWCAPIGMHDEDLQDAGPDAFVLTASGFSSLLPTRGESADKRSSGAPLIVAGSGQFPGAAILCALGAARAGAGYVTLAVPQGALETVRAHLVEQVVVPFDDTDARSAIQTIADLAKHCSSIAIGPGLALNETVGTIVREVVSKTPLPMVADASALHFLAGQLDGLHDDGRLILTPHEGEFALVSGRGTIAPGRRRERLRAFVDEFGITTLLKGRTTLVADRTSLHLNATGTSALATAGTGDVLSGIIATLLSQGLAPVDAGRAGAFWHGRAGACAAAARPVGVIARDVAESLGLTSHGPPDGRPIRIF